ncbi:MAG TPA: hypothetical protein VMJ10_02695 [Kofleriaceae bacterium]|nr:hypothetical protein [Kofleriaceae bacterium]
MKLQAIVVAGVLAWGAVARAQSAAELEADGEKAAKEGSYAEAIDKFKAADRLEVRASHACLIALAYTRRNLWPQAEIFRDRCHTLAKERNEPLPDWIDTADKQIADAIAKAIASQSVAEVTITVEPAEVAATALVTVSSFAPDEKFAPRAIHLPTGIHQLFVSAPGYDIASQLVDIKDSRPQQVAIRLHRPGEGPPPLKPETPAKTGPSKLPWVIAGIGVGVAAVGGVLDATWYDSAYDTLAKTPKSSLDYASAEDTWSQRRNVVIACYVAGGLAAVTGVVLKYTVFKHAEHPPAVSITPIADGGVLSFGWSR